MLAGSTIATPPVSLFERFGLALSASLPTFVSASRILSLIGWYTRHRALLLRRYDLSVVEMIARTCPARTFWTGFPGLLLVGVRFAVAFEVLTLGTVAIKTGLLGGLIAIVHFLGVALDAPAGRVHTLACRILGFTFLAAAAGKPVRTSVVIGPLALIWSARHCFFPSDSGHRLLLTIAHQNEPTA